MVICQSPGQIHREDARKAGAVQVPWIELLKNHFGLGCKGHAFHPSSLSLLGIPLSLL